MSRSLSPQQQLPFRKLKGKSTFHFSHHQEIPSREEKKKAEGDVKKKTFKVFFSLDFVRI